MFKSLFGKFIGVSETISNDPNHSENELSHLLSIAKQTLYRDDYEIALGDLQKLVLRGIQSRHMANAYFKSNAIAELSDANSFGLTYLPMYDDFLQTYLWKNCKLPDDALPIARLASDIVLPTCWNSTSIVDLLGRFGEHRSKKAWKQDFLNHKVVSWYPLNIFWVRGGNHSITQGILCGEGAVKCDEAYDLTPLYGYIHFDGDNWIEAETGRILGTPRYKEFGYVFEIGRLIHDKRNH